MFISKLITSLQQAANTATSSYDLMVITKAIDKLKTGSVSTASTLNSLPSNLSTDGNLYYVTQTETLYYNIGSKWEAFTGSFNISYGWGSNNSGRLGDGTTTSRLSPVSVIGGITNWSQVSAGFSHSLGLTSSGIAYGWGYNFTGQLGDGTTVNKSSPVSVIGGITNWSQVSAGDNHSLGLTSTGIAYGWGSNGKGQLGDGTTTSKLSPVSVIGGITNWSQVSAGGSHNLGLTSTGIAYGWGFNGSGQLGDGTTTSKSSPVSVIGGITNWSQVSAGSSHSLGLTSTGVAYGWGYNGFGQLGDGTTTSRLSPVSVIGGITNWSQVDAGFSHSLGLTSTLFP